MEKLKEALVKFAELNPSLFRHDDFNSYSSLIERRFSQFFLDFQTPSHPPYAAMIHKAIRELNRKKGSSEESISNYIKQEHADLPWAHSTLLKHHLEKLCDRKEISITPKQRYLIPDADSDPISISKSEKRLKRKQNLESGKKNSKRMKSGHLKKCKKNEEMVVDLEVTKNQITEVFQEQEQDQEDVMNNGSSEPECLKIKYQTCEKRNNLIDVCIDQDMDEGGVFEKDKDQIEKRGKKKQKLKRKSKRRGKRGKKNEGTRIQDLSEADLKRDNEEIDCEVNEKNQGIRVVIKSEISKMSNMQKDAEEAKQASRAVSTGRDGQRTKLGSFKKKKGMSRDHQNHKTCGKIRRSSRKRKAPSRLD